MNNKPLVSILSPVYNGEEHIEECIKAVLNQTYKNFEYVIVDNASTDNTPAIIEKYAEQDRRIKAFRNQKTVCMEDNCNICAQHSSDKAKWIKYALADDYLFPDCVEKMVDVGESDDQIGMVSAYRMAGNLVTNLGLPIEENVFEGSLILKRQILRKLHVASSSPNTVLYRRDVFLELRGFNNQYDHSDTELAFRLLDRYKLGFVHYVLTRSGRDKGGGEYSSIMSGNKTREYLDFGYKNIRKYRSIVFDMNEMNHLRKYYAEEIADFIVTKLARMDWTNIKTMLQAAPDDIKQEMKKSFSSNPFHYVKRYLTSLNKRK
jgi:glycosyltransferase involved in cell wall biosynthesis